MHASVIGPKQSLKPDPKRVRVRKLSRGSAVATLAYRADFWSRLPHIGIAVALPLCLAGCDAWPTGFKNNTDHATSMRYWHKDYDKWSSPFPYEAGESIRLAREHYFQDIECVEITDSARVYEFNGDELAKLSRVCANSWNCEMTYLGDGRLHTRRGAAEGEFEPLLTTDRIMPWRLSSAKSAEVGPSDSGCPREGEAKHKSAG